MTEFFKFATSGVWPFLGTLVIICFILGIPFGAISGVGKEWAYAFIAKWTVNEGKCEKCGTALQDHDI